MTTERPFGLVLAGGLARRMGGGDKARIRIGGKTILERVLTRLTPQCSGVILNANGDLARFADTGLRVVADSIPDFAGPLAGILAGLDWAAANVPGIADIVSVPGDCPFLPPDLVERLSAARQAAGAPLACARSGDWRHPVVGLWRVASRSPTGRRRRSIRSSTSTRPTMRPRPSALQRSNATIELSSSIPICCTMRQIKPGERT
jgi:molybdenum cofactor guanylyltransferase